MTGRAILLYCAIGLAGAALVGSALWDSGASADVIVRGRLTPTTHAVTAASPSLTAWCFTSSTEATSEEVVDHDVVDGVDRVRIPLRTLHSTPIVGVLRGSAGATCDAQTHDFVQRVRVVPSRSVFAAALGVLLLVVPLLVVVRRPRKGDAVRPWTEILSEPGPDGGLSLSRVQLALWWTPTFCAWAGLSIVERNFTPMTGSVAALLGLSAVTRVVGGAASTAEVATADPATAGSTPPPVLRDLVTDAEGRSDLTRYQYLALSVVGAILLIAGFIRTVDVVDIPSWTLAVIAAGQATYVGAKIAANARASAPGP